MAAYDAICFDLDSTLSASRPGTPRPSSSRRFERAGCEQFCTPADLRAAVPDLPTAETDREFYEHLFTEVTGRAGIDSGIAPTLAAAHLEVQDPTAVEFRPGAEAALERARDLGRVGLITNGGRPTQTQKLEALGIADAFDARVFTEPSAGILPKPNAAPFERARSPNSRSRPTRRSTLATRSTPISRVRTRWDSIRPGWISAATTRPASTCRPTNSRRSRRSRRSSESDRCAIRPAGDPYVPARGTAYRVPPPSRLSSAAASGKVSGRSNGSSSSSSRCLQNLTNASRFS